MRIGGSGWGGGGVQCAIHVKQTHIARYSENFNFIDWLKVK